MNFKVFGKTLLATLLAGAIQGASQALTNQSGDKINLSQVGIGAAIGAIALLVRSPMQQTAAAPPPKGT